MQVQMMTKDNVKLVGQLIESRGEAKAIVLLNPGTATKTSFYMPFANFLAENGFHVLLWNYRGFGESRSGSLAGSTYTYAQIGKFDIPSVIEKAKSLYPDLPLYCVGHSAGGQQLGLAYNFDLVDKFIAVAVSGGHFSYMPFGYRIKANFFFRFFAPITSMIFRYVPAGKMDFMEDLPSGLAKEWGDWCKEREYFFSPKFYGKTIPEGTAKNFKMPIHVFTADDDEISTKRNVENFWKNVHSSGGIQFTWYKSLESPQKKITHFGYFKKANRYIWEDILSKLN